MLRYFFLNFRDFSENQERIFKALSKKIPNNLNSKWFQVFGNRGSIVALSCFLKADRKYKQSIDQLSIEEEVDNINIPLSVHVKYDDFFTGGFNDGPESVLIHLRHLTNTHIHGF